MEFNIILAGVGGQGILTIAQVISTAAVRRGWNVKQAETHGMSQRGGAVVSHLRVGDSPLYSDLIPLGRADLILAVEPLEALRYLPYLAPRGAVVTSGVPFLNISHYPAIETVLDRVAKIPDHLIVDADRLARAAGSMRAANTVMVGAASVHLPLGMAELDEAIREMFERKGDAVVATNQRASRFGRNAALAYRDGMRRGLKAAEVRQWLDGLSAEVLAAEDAVAPDAVEATCDLTNAEADAVAQLLMEVEHDDRKQLHEHEVYRIVELVGAITPPKHLFVPNGEPLAAESVARFPGDRLVLKIVSPDVVHKSDVGGVVFVAKDVDAVRREIDRLTTVHSRSGAAVAGVLIVEFVDHHTSGFGQELFVGIRSTREFGPVIAAGLGGIDTEFLAHKMRPGIAVAKALAVDVSAEQFFELFRQTAGYEILAGRARGHARVVSDGELVRCFRAFIAMARRFCVDRGREGPDLHELEVNPFAFARQRMVPLDGRGRLGTTTSLPPARPLHKMSKLIEPRSIAVLGVSGKRANFGRIIVDNILACGFPREKLYIVKDGVNEIEGIRCVPTVTAFSNPVDLLVVSAASGDLPELMKDVIASGKIGAVILIPGGAGETKGTEDIHAQVRSLIQHARHRPDEGPVVIGGNCLGVRSRPGAYDTFFVPKHKLSTQGTPTPRRLALISQSGAFIVSRMSNLEALDPAISVSVGNQVDVTVSDLLRTVGRRDDIDCIGVYVEGFNDLDGLAFTHAVAELRAAGKVIIFYKAGRTAPGRAATAGHTASVAGDYDICQAAAAQAGAIVTDTFKEFEQLLELATLLHHKDVAGCRVAGISNAGFETVGMADTILGARYELSMPPLHEGTVRRLETSLKQHGLSGLVNPRNPLDLTPMADDDMYEAAVRATLDDESVDALIVATIPLTPKMATTEEEMRAGGSLPERLGKVARTVTKPVIAVVDAGPVYDALVRRLRDGGIPTFRSCDQAVRSLGRYLCHRTTWRSGEVNRRLVEPVTRHELPAAAPTA